MCGYRSVYTDVLVNFSFNNFYSCDAVLVRYNNNNNNNNNIHICIAPYGRNFRGAVYCHVSVCLSVCLSVTSRSSIKKAELIELVIGFEAIPSVYPTGNAAISQKNKLLPSGTLSQTLNGRKISQLKASVVNLGSPIYHTERPPLMDVTQRVARVCLRQLRLVTISRRSCRRICRW